MDSTVGQLKVLNLSFILLIFMGFPETFGGTRTQLKYETVPRESLD